MKYLRDSYLMHFPLCCSILASLNLPAALEEESGAAVPHSLVEKANAVIALGGVTALQNQITDLPELLQRNRDILVEVCCPPISVTIQ